DEAPVLALEKPAVELGENLRWILAHSADGVQHANEHGDDHGGAEPFAADVANHNKGLAVTERDDLKEISAHLCGGTVDAVDGVPRSGRQHFWHHEPLDFAGRSK